VVYKRKATATLAFQITRRIMTLKAIRAKIKPYPRTSAATTIAAERLRAAKKEGIGGGRQGRSPVGLFLSPSFNQRKQERHHEDGAVPVNT
jgi:hypothetical protein